MSIAGFPSYDDYQETGYEWLGSAPSHWGVSRLGRSLTPVSEKNRPDLPLLSITREQGVIERDIEDQESNHNFIPDDLSNYKVLRAGQFGMNKMKAWQGSYGVSQHTGIVSPAYYVFKFAELVDPDYFNIAIRSKLYVSYFGSASDGVRIGQWDLNKMRMKEIPFLLPPLHEQKRIAQFLDEKTAKIDQAISIKEQQIALLKERKKIIVWEVVTKGINSHAPMKDSGIFWIGKMPTHWMLKKIKHYTWHRSGDGITNSQLSEDGLFQVYGGNGFIGYHDKYNVDGKYIVVGRVGALCGNVRFESGKKWVSDNALIFRFSNEIDGAYLAIIMEAADLNKLNESNAQPLITGTKVANVSIPIAPANERAALIDQIRRLSRKIDDAIDLKMQQIGALKDYKTSLINEAVTGKIKVA